MVTRTRISPSARRRAGIVAMAALVSACVLTGCARDDVAPEASTTPSPAPTISAPSFTGPAPESAGDAIASATAALDEFVRVENLIFAEGGMEPERIDAISVPPASNEVYSSAEAIASQGLVLTGGIVTTVIDAYATDLSDATQSLPFAAVNLQICNDGSQRTVSLPDGSAAQQPAKLVFTLNVSVQYDPDASMWKVRSFTGGGAEC